MLSVIYTSTNSR